MSARPSRVTLVPPLTHHAAEWLRWRGQRQARRHNPFDDLDLAALQARLRRSSTDVLEDGCDRWLWVIEADACPVGVISAVPNRRMETATLGYHVDEEWFGRGVATAAVRQVTERLFVRPTLRKQVAFIAATNLGSRTVIERAGFVLEGNLRGHVVIGGAPVDQCVYGRLRDDPLPTFVEGRWPSTA